jgi:phytoene dehydrogenase-like protein
VSWDAVVIGAGVNGLTAAAYLAKRGRTVLVLERRDDVDPLDHTGWVPSRIARELHLDRHGLVITRSDPWITAPLDEGDRLELSSDVRRSGAAIARLSRQDARRWPEFCERMHRLARFLETLYETAPPVIANGGGFRHLANLAAAGWRFRRLGKTGMTDLLRVLPMSVGDLLDEWFENPVLKGVLGAGAVHGIRQGPRSGGTAFLFLHHHVGCLPGVFRPATLSAGVTGGPDAAFAQAAKAHGVEIRRGVTVARVDARHGRATGVVLESGEQLAAPLILSSADPRRTFLEFLEPGVLDPEFTRAVSHLKFRGAYGRIELEVSVPPSFTTLCISPSLEYLERAYDATKYGQQSSDPWVDARASSAGGQPRVTLHVQYAPFRLRDGSWDGERRSALGDRAVRVVDAEVRGFASTVTRRTVLSPVDLEAIYGANEGSLSHGEMTLDQILFMRPVPGWSHYRTPVPGLYLCGAGAHPGGGIAGAAGRLAAQAALGKGR